MKLPGTATQEENIHIAMGKLNVQEGNIFLDIGCGSGAVSFAASRFTEKIYGIDMRAEAIELSKSLVPSGLFFKGEASQIIPDLPSVDRCFIGGTQNIEKFLPELMNKAAQGCIIVADLARIGMASKVVKLMKDQGIFYELLHIQIARGYDLAGDIALRPVNPIFMVVGRC